MLENFIYKIKRPYHFFKTALRCGIPAQIRYRFPSKKIKIIAITGTDGKTTSSTLAYHVLKSAGKKVGLISTVAAYMGDEEIATGLHITAPDPKKLQWFIRKMVDQKFKYLVLEFTSHGAYQYRTWGVKPYVAGVTNIAHEHLDYHVNIGNYLEAKALLLKKSPSVVLNADDKNYFKLRRLLNAQKQKLLIYSAEDKLPTKLSAAVKKRFPEAYNQMNARLVIKIAQLLQLKESDIIKGIKKFPGIPGRMQFVANKRGFETIVDFAHTPQALEAGIKALRQRLNKQKSKGRLIAVYGCAGLRDRQKRPMMGKIGVELADLVVFTAEDPRTEDIWTIIRQMKEQLTSGHNKIISIANRQDAIDFTINKLAKKGDIIGFFGKGPEKSMCYGTVEHEWDEVEAVKKALGETAVERHGGII